MVMMTNKKNLSSPSAFSIKEAKMEFRKGFFSSDKTFSEILFVMME